MKEKTELPTYQDPVITTHHDEEILEELGPAQTYGPNGGNGD